MDRTKLLNDLDTYAHYCRGEVFKKVLQDSANTIRELSERERTLAALTDNGINRKKLLRVLKKAKEEATRISPIKDVSIRVDIDEMIELIENMPPLTETHIEIRPRKKSDQGGYVCMPMLKNIPQRHKNWKLVECPECGAPCWRTPEHDLVERTGAIALCTECVLRKGANNE